MQKRGDEMLWHASSTTKLMMTLTLLLVSCRGTAEPAVASKVEDKPPGVLRSQFNRLNQVIDTYHDDYERYPQTLKEAWDRPGLQSIKSSIVIMEPDFSAWEYVSLPEKGTCKFSHKKYPSLSRMDPNDRGAIPALKQDIASADTEEKLKDLDSLRGIQSQQVTDLILDLLKDKNRRVRARAAAILIGRKYTPRPEDLKRVLNDPEPDVRRYAVPLMASLPDEERITRLLELFNKQDDVLRWTAVMEFAGEATCDCPHHLRPSRLGKPKDPRTVKPLVERLQDKCGSVRAAAAMALSHYQDPSTTEALVGELTDTASYQYYNSASAYAAYALAEMKVTVPPQRLRDALLSSEKRSLQYIKDLVRNHPQKVEIKKMVQQAIPQRLQSQNEWELVGVLNALQNFPMPELEPKTMELSRHPSPQVRASAIRALQNNRSDQWQTRLLELVMDKNQLVRYETAHALSIAGTQEGLSALLALYHSKPEWRSKLIQSIGRFDQSEVLPFLSRVVEEGGDGECRLACYSIQSKLQRKKISVEDLRPLKETLRQRLDKLPENQRIGHPGQKLLERIK